jgi:hypothetical protein
MYNLLSASFVEPGILPANLSPHKPEMPAEMLLQNEDTPDGDRYKFCGA